MYDFTRNYEYVVIIDECEVSYEYYGNDFRAAVQTISDIKALCPTACVRYFHNGKEVILF